MNHFLSISTLVLVASLSVACSKSESSAPSPSGAAAAAPAAAKPLEIAGTHSSFTPPAGWDTAQKGPWTIMTAKPDAKGNVPALMAFVTFNQPNESTAKLGTLATVLELNDIHWGGRETLELPSGFPATGAAGTAKDSSGGAVEVHYLTINPGGSEQILFVYAVDAGEAKSLEPGVVASVRSLKKNE